MFTANRQSKAGRTIPKSQQAFVTVEVHPFFGSKPIFLQNKIDNRVFAFQASSGKIDGGKWRQANVPDFILASPEVIAAVETANTQNRKDAFYRIARIRIPLPDSSANNQPLDQMVFENRNPANQQGHDTTFVEPSSAATMAAHEGAAYAPAPNESKAGFGGGMVLILGLAAVGAAIYFSKNQNEEQEPLKGIPIAS